MAATKVQRSKAITLEQLAKHNDEKSLWIAVHGSVYDLTDFRRDHPGGVEVLLNSAGTDGTEAYEYAAHSEGQMLTMQQFRIGKLAGASPKASTNAHDLSLGQMKRAKGARPILQRTKLAVAIVATSVAVAIACRYFLPSLSADQTLFPSLTGNSTARAFWAGAGLASSAGFLAFRYIYLLFLSSLDFQSDVFKYPPTIPRKHKHI
ncbi:cytochrome b5-like heme/steroid binding domain-containing protein [Xylariaceae sp. FL0255]|nr:cytochrome b5-like heme/steroid binding domain-containing protein [Xylariaceae sp. FL0255]